MKRSAACEGGRSSRCTHSTLNRIGGSNGRKPVFASLLARAVNSSTAAMPAPQRVGTVAM